MIDIVFACVVLLIIVFLAYGYFSNYLIQVETYTINNISLEEKTNIKIVMLADLHGLSFGQNNRRILDKVMAVKPDVICIAGDMTVKNGKGFETAICLCKELLQIAPVCYGMGNHEIRMDAYEKYIMELKRIGVAVLLNSSIELIIAENPIRIYGLDMNEQYYHKVWEKRVLSQDYLEQCLGTSDENHINVLIAHNPEYFQQYAAWGAQLVCSGHVHGGIARLPILGGVIDPSLRLFPKYDSGLFECEDAKMILTRGLGTHHIKLRFFNRPEISVIELSN